MPLTEPSRSLRTTLLPTVDVKIPSLHRISRYASGEPFFGFSAINRFDDCNRVKSLRYGTCYCGFDLETAIAETVLHDEMPVRGKFAISYSDFSSRYHLRFQGRTLRLADLTGLALKTLGGDGSISTVIPYRLPQLWSRAVHQNPLMVDGIYYMSRHLNDRPAVVIFDRAKHKVTGVSYTPLPKTRRVFVASTALHISFQYP